MGVATETETWVGRPVRRLEDEALLRGEGRFMDDLDPVPHAGHAAVLRSLLAHARIARLDASAALELPGVIGVLTGADVAAMSRPFPVGVDGARPYYAAAAEVARYAGEPLAVVVARDRYVAEDALELIEVEYDPLEPVLDPEAGEIVSDRSFSYGDPDEAFAQADLVVEEPFHFPRWSGTPVECYGVVADWNAAAGSLTAWANFQGPFTLHSVAAGALGLPGSRLRLITPPDSGGSFGIKATVYVYVVLMGLASKHLGVPVRWIEDRVEHLAASSASTARTTTVRAGFSAAGELLALAYDVVEDVGAYIRAPEPATLYRMHGSLLGRLPRAERRRQEPGRAHEPLSHRPQPRLRRPAALPRARGGDERRRASGSGSTRPSCAAGTWSSADEFPVPHTLRRSLRLRRLRGVPRPRARARRATRSGATSRRTPAAQAARSGSASRAWSSPRSRTWATSRSRRRRPSARRRCRSRATPRARP